MSLGVFTESIVEDATLARFDALGYQLTHSPAIAAQNAGRDSDYQR